MISWRNVTFTHPGAAAPALRDVTLDLADGELLLVAGPSGAGKSTLLRCGNGLVPHFSGGTFAGTVTVAGKDTRTHKPRDLAEHVGFVAQEPDGGSVAATVEDEVAFVLENLGAAPALMRKRIEETLDALSIAHLRERRLETLSGGERQRVAIASVLVAAPRALILDEPTSQLDPQSAEEVLQTVLRLSHEMGIGVMLAEHRLERVAAFADRLCIVEDGRVRAGEVRQMLAGSPVAPPVVRLAQALGEQQMPVSVRDARVEFGDRPRYHAEASVDTPGDCRLAARNLRVAYAGREALRIESLDVHAGETVAVAGRNGAGKTTLLRAIIGLARKVSGTVTLDGRVCTSVEDAAQAAAFVPQNAARLLSRFAAREEAPEQVLADWDLSHIAGRDPRDLSSGEATWLALAAACANDPGIVLLDEPTRGMDEPGKQRLAERLQRWREQGRAVVIVTHDVELIAESATRVALMSDGAIVLDGPMREVLGESVMFSSQMNKVFRDPRIATVADAVAALG